MKANLHYLTEFIAAVFRHWINLATGGVVMAGVWVYSEVLKRPVLENLGWYLLFVFVVIAAFLTWRDERKHCESLGLKNEPIRIVNLLGSFLREALDLMNTRPTIGLSDVEDWRLRVRETIERELGEVYLVHFDFPKNPTIGGKTTEPTPRTLLRRLTEALEEIIQDVKCRIR